MTTALEDAIFDLVTKAKADGSVLRVAEAAERLAKDHGADQRETADLIINAGLTHGVNMEMWTPDAQGRPEGRGSAP